MRIRTHNTSGENRPMTEKDSRNRNSDAAFGIVFKIRVSYDTNKNDTNKNVGSDVLNLSGTVRGTTLFLPS
jgi:hypothetical protein